MCEEEAEVNGHLFLHCRIATDLWNMFICMLQGQLVNAQNPF